MRIQIQTTAGLLHFDGRKWTGGEGEESDAAAARLNSLPLPDGGPHHSTADRATRLARNAGLEPELLTVEGLNEDTGEDAEEAEVVPAP